MDILNDLRSIMTVVSLVTFLGIVWWAFSRRNGQRFEEAANLPFAEDDEAGAAPGGARQR